MSFFFEMINLWQSKIIRIHRGNKVKSFLLTLSAFVMVGSLFFYFVNWFSEVKSEKSAKVIETAAALVLKKLPPLVSNELVSISSNSGMDYQSATRSGERTVTGDSQPAGDSLGGLKVVKKLSAPPNDKKTTYEILSDDYAKNALGHSELPEAGNTEITTAPEEPDPASAIDYVIKKRRL